ncbi:carbohydrate ABC transporter ATP-binding protein, CUT1 family [Synechococcus sp. PCC 6312]|nr:ATP-binding cassette domain-containing protein [Synechococcus sp. PCC 6312]AFY60834.1 carbohydrate ABC transporter ATP-binding protein, CUT1 family [Synechococcus sp. PCC 6312]
MAEVVLEQLSKSYGGAGSGHLPISVLTDINLNIQDQEFIVLVGPSGCGKSTLLRLIAGLEEPSAGKIWVGDRCVNNLPPKARDIAMVFQSYALYPHLTVADNLAFGLRRSVAPDMPTPTRPGFLTLPLPLASGLQKLTGWLPKPLRYRDPRELAIQQRVNAVATMLQIEPLLNRYPKQLSGGQKQRVALGRAMARNPQAFLMDEPLSNLDAKLRTETRAQIVQLQRQLGVTTVYVTHDQTEAMTMGDRIVVLQGGQIQQLGTPLDLYQRPANRFVAEFIGSPPMNFVTGLVNDQGEFVVGDWSLPLKKQAHIKQAWPGKPLTLGIRAEHLYPASDGPGHLLGVVALVEALGHETSLVVEIQSVQEALAWRVRVPAQLLVKVGDSLWLRLDEAAIHWFDPNTGQVLCSEL